MRIGVFIAATALLPAAALASDQPQNSWTCNANAGQYSRNGLDTSTALSVSGNIEFKEKHSGTDWSEVATIRFRKKRESKEFGGINLYYASHNDKELTISIAGFDTGAPRVVAHVGAGGPIPFKVAIDADGTVTAIIKGRAFVAKGYKFRSGIAQISCSSAIVDFTDLSLPVIIY